jgi:hypothetical protein
MLKRNLAPPGPAPTPAFKVVVWTRFTAPPAALWDLCTDPAEIASLTPAWLRWELSNPEGLRAQLRAGVAPGEPSGPAHATRLRALGRLWPWPVRVAWSEPPLRYALTTDAPWAAPGELRVRLERAMAGRDGERVRLVHEWIWGPPPGAVGALAGRAVAEAARRALVAVHRGVSARAGVPEVGATSSRVVPLSAAMAGHADDPLGTGAPPEVPGG